MTEVCLLGTGGMLPLPERFLTSLYVSVNGKALLIDCGEGTQVALAKTAMKLSRISTILITHAHADHVAGLPGLLLSLGNTSRTAPLTIFCPDAAAEPIKGLLGVCGYLPYELCIIPLDSKSETSFTCEEIDPLLTVTAMPLSHSVECLGYRLSLARKPRFLPEKAKELGIPTAYYRALHAGETVTLDDGRLILPEEVTSEPRRPTVITYVTDTLPLPCIAEFARGSQLLVCEGMYGSADKKDSMESKGHMLMQDACRLAGEAGAERLWLTHYSPAEKSPSDYTEELKSIFPAVTVSEDGQFTEL